MAAEISVSMNRAAAAMEAARGSIRVLKRRIKTMGILLPGGLPMKRPIQLRKGQCGLNRTGRRMCVLPNIGARFVAWDFDAVAEGFEEVTVPEQPKMILASEVGADAVLEDMDGMEGLERHLESDVFV